MKFLTSNYQKIWKYKNKLDLSYLHQKDYKVGVLNLSHDTSVIQVGVATVTFSSLIV